MGEDLIVTGLEKALASPDRSYELVLGDLRLDEEFLVRLAREVHNRDWKDFQVYLDATEKHDCADEIFLWYRRITKDLPLNLKPVGALTPAFEVAGTFERTKILFERVLKTAKTPKFSIIAPVKKGREGWLKKFLESVSSLSFSNDQFELILVADGDFPISLDVEVYLNRVAQLRFYSVGRSEMDADLFRVGELRNLGAALARGEVLIFSDSDLWLGPLLLQTIERTLSEPWLWIQACRQQSSKLLMLLEGRHWKHYGEDDFSWNAEKAPWLWASSYCFAIRKEEFMQVGGFSNRFESYGYEDTELGYRWQRAGGSFQKIRLPVLHLERGLGTFFRKLFLKYAGLRPSATRFYLLHLDSLIYDRLFTLIGPRRLVRWGFKKITDLPPWFWRRPLALIIGGDVARRPFHLRGATAWPWVRAHAHRWIIKSPMAKIWYYYLYHYRRNYQRLWFKERL